MALRERYVTVPHVRPGGESLTGCQQRYNHATRARSSSVEVRWWRTDPRDRSADWRGSVDSAGDAQALPGCWLSWPLPEDADAALKARLFANAGPKHGHRRHIKPDWAAIHRELKRKHVTLSILRDEYIEREPQGYSCSRFCELGRSWEANLSVTMRQTHVGGDKLFVAYAGDTVPVIIGRLSGERRQAQIFVAVMGASNFTYVEATWTRGSLIGSVRTRGPSRRSSACRAS